MSSCFYNENGTMAGIDIHDYVALGPEGAPLEMSNGYMVSLAFYQTPRFKDQARITIDGRASFQAMADWYFISHTMIPVPPPHPNEMVVLSFIIFGSSSKAWMSTHSVHLNGEPAAICLRSLFSSNLNCAQPIAGIGGNVVVNLSSVVTEPTPGDYAGSFVRMCLSAVRSWLVGQGTREAAQKIAEPIDNGLKDVARRFFDGIGKHVVRRANDAVGPEHKVIKTLIDPTKAYSKWVQETVDRALEGSP